MADESVIIPSYYNKANMSVIDIIDEYELNFNKWNIIKYILRSGKHIITHPFDASEFYLKIGELAKLGSNLIKKNDVTLLYENT